MAQPPDRKRVPLRRTLFIFRASLCTPTAIYTLNDKVWWTRLRSVTGRFREMQCLALNGNALDGKDIGILWGKPV